MDKHLLGNHIMSLPRGEYDNLVKLLSESKNEVNRLKGIIQDHKIGNCPNKVVVMPYYPNGGETYSCSRGTFVHFLEGSEDFEKLIKERYQDPQEEVVQLLRDYDELKKKHEALRKLLKEALK